jgi:L-lactate dehydrogenase complex protein LldF
MSEFVNHAARAKAFIADRERTDWHNEAVGYLRDKRDLGAATVSEWEALKDLASQIKNNVLANLDEYLLQFETNARKNGAQVHWAADAADHNRIVSEILQTHGVKLLVKSKSMLTEECHLNQALENLGIEVVDTDLGERIIQWRNEGPVILSLRPFTSGKRKSANYSMKNSKPRKVLPIPNISPKQRESI